MRAKLGSRNKACRFVLDGEDERSELTLGGDGTYNADDTFAFREGAEYWYSFSPGAVERRSGNGRLTLRGPAQHERSAPDRNPLPRLRPGAGVLPALPRRELVDSRRGVNMIVPGRGFAYIKGGIYRNGDAIPGKSVLLLDSVELGVDRPG